MKSRRKKVLVLAALAVFLLLLMVLPSGLIVNWFMGNRLFKEPDRNRRIVLINTTLKYNPEYWNPRYLRCALLAETDYERKFMADLIQERFRTNATFELHRVLERETSEAGKSNASEVIRLLEGSNRL